MDSEPDTVTRDGAVLNPGSGPPRGVDPGRARRRPRWRRRITVAAAVLVVVVVGVFVAAWYGTAIGIEPNHPTGTHPEVVLGVTRAGGGPPVVTLTASRATTTPGTYGLAWDGGAAMLGDVVAQTPGRVQRTLLSGAVPSVGTPAAVGASYSGDPKSALGLDFSEIMVPTELGPTPAWYIPATSPAGPAGSTWAITVHGSNAKRNADLRYAATLHRAGLPILSITYRNDVGAPASPDGLMHLGASEWRDLDAAARTAEGLGARRIVLYGGSMGGAIVGQFLTHSPRAATVSAVVLDAPMLSVPAVANPIGNQIIAWRTGVDVTQLDLLTHPPAYRPPTLIFFGGADTQLPIQPARDLTAQGPQLHWPIQFEEFPGADHNLVWNTDRVRYENALTAFLARTVGAR